MSVGEEHSARREPIDVGRVELSLVAAEHIHAIFHVIYGKEEDVRLLGVICFRRATGEQGDQNEAAAAGPRFSRFS